MVREDRPTGAAVLLTELVILYFTHYMAGYVHHLHVPIANKTAISAKSHQALGLFCRRDLLSTSR